MTLMPPPPGQWPPPTFIPEEEPVSLPWAWWPWHRCRAVKEPDSTVSGGGYFGRCDLVRGHFGDHALERGMETPRWSTRWTA